MRYVAPTIAMTSRRPGFAERVRWSVARPAVIMADGVVDIVRRVPGPPTRIDRVHESPIESRPDRPVNEVGRSPLRAYRSPEVQSVIAALGAAPCPPG